MNTQLYVGEALGSAILVLFGNGAVANEHLRRTKGERSGYLFIAFGFGFAVMLGVIVSLPFTAGTINPAVTLGKALHGIIPWNQVIWLIAAQMIGAVIGQLIVVAMYWEYLKATEGDPERQLAIFSTTTNVDRKRSYFLGEFIATFALTLIAFLLEEQKVAAGVTAITLGFTVTALVISLGGGTGPGANPARDLGPRIVHALLPIPGKGDSQWRTAWIPVVAPILGSLLAAATFWVLPPLS
jgi:glycerol uptake facilitator protein